MQPILGALADMLGKTRMMFACLVIVTFSTFAGAFAPGLLTLMASRVISGIVAGGTFPIALALIAQVVTVEKRQVAVSRVLAGAMLGNLMGSAAAGIVADSFGWRGVFLVNGFCALAALVAAFIGFGGPGRKPPERVDLRSIPATYRAMFRHPMAKYCFGGVLMEGIFLFGFFPYVAPFLHAAGESRATIAGIVIGGFGVGGMIYATVISRLLPLVGQRKLMITGGDVHGARADGDVAASAVAGAGRQFSFYSGWRFIFCTVSSRSLSPNSCRPRAGPRPRSTRRSSFSDNRLGRSTTGLLSANLARRYRSLSAAVS